MPGALTPQPYKKHPQSLVLHGLALERVGKKCQGPPECDPPSTGGKLTEWYAYLCLNTSVRARRVLTCGAWLK